MNQETFSPCHGRIRKFIKKCGGFKKAIEPCLPEIIKYYKESAPILGVLSHFGIEISVDDILVKAPCPYSNEDSCAHAEVYYWCRRHEDETKSEVLYCTKCGLHIDNLPLISDIEKSTKGSSIIEVFEFIEQNLGIEFPWYIPFMHFGKQIDDIQGLQSSGDSQ